MTFQTISYIITIIVLLISEINYSTRNMVNIKINKINI